MPVGRAIAQLENPIPTPIVKQGFRVEIRDAVQFPLTNGLSRPNEQGRAAVSHARINFLREIPWTNGSSRRFVNDLRGIVYELDNNNQVTTYWDFHGEFSNTSNLIYGAGLATGLICFTFNPDFSSNGILYTIHAEGGPDNSNATGTPERDPDFMPPGYVAGDATYHTVISEWTVSDPTATSLNAGNLTRREMLRVGHVTNSYFHPFGDLQFNPHAVKGGSDDGILYISGGDWAFINGGGPNDNDPSQLQRLDSLAGTMLRIDPRSPAVSGGPGGKGDYTIPLDNPFVDGNPNTLDEILAYGFRNGHRMAWDEMGNLFVCGIGQANIEEVNRVVAGANYGWADREGTFVNGSDTDDGGNGNANEVFALDATADDDDDFLYPVLQYDHGEGFAIAGGFVYQGSNVPALVGRFVFGDIVRGRIFAASVSEMQSINLTDPTTTGAIEEIQLFTVGSNGAEFDVELRSDLTNGAVSDLRFGADRNGELYVLTKYDGMLRGLGPVPVDTDGDGLIDALDDCPINKPDQAVDAGGRPLGDFDFDCQVGIADLGILVANLTGPLGESCGTLGDIDDNCQIDLIDYSLLQSNVQP